MNASVESLRCSSSDDLSGQDLSGRDLSTHERDASAAHSAQRQRRATNVEEGFARLRPSFDAFAEPIRARIDTQLGPWLDASTTGASATSDAIQVVVDAIRSLTLRGGKRIRPVLLSAAYVACGGSGGAPAVTMAGVAMELLQAYFLIHDDWMDDDDLRRGGPSVHAALRDHFQSERLGATLGVLAGDYSAALSLEALLNVDCEPSRVAEAMREFARMQADAVTGQIMDVGCSSGSHIDVDEMHRRKTGSYTVRGPLALGAILAGASAEQRRGLHAYSDPLGLAFQLRDDLLGIFGDGSVTGKPIGGDLREGKRTAVIAEALKHPDGPARVLSVLGRSDATPQDVQLLVDWLIEAKVKEGVEQRITALLRQSFSELSQIQITVEGKEVLAGAIHALGCRAG